MRGVWSERERRSTFILLTSNLTYDAKQALQEYKGQSQNENGIIANTIIFRGVVHHDLRDAPYTLRRRALARRRASTETRQTVKGMLS